MSEGYADQEGYPALVAYDLLNLFASNYLITQDGNIITGDKIISNGNCMFHALGYAYYASLTETLESDENYAVPKNWVAANAAPSYNIVDDVSLTTKYYDETNSISHLKTDDNKRDINDKALELKTRVAQTIINFNKYYNKINPTHVIDANIVTTYYDDDTNTEKTLTLKMFINPIDKNEQYYPADDNSIKNEQYYPADDNSIYASAFLLNKIICIINCRYVFGFKNCHDITHYQLFGPINMFCTTNNILFLLYVHESHYETFYPENTELKISVKKNIVDKFNELISKSKNKPANNNDNRMFVAPEPFLNHLESYSFYSRDIVIDFTQKPTIDNAKLKSKVTNKDSFEAEFEHNKEFIESINPKETDQDKLYDNQALLNKLLTENQELTDIINMPELHLSEEDTRTCNDRSKKLTGLIGQLVDKQPIVSPNNSPPPSLLKKPTSLPTSSSNNPSSTPIVSTPKKYSFYSKERPPLNLTLTNPIQYTPYIFRVRTRKPLNLILITE